MPLFVPPTTAGLALADPHKRDAANRLFRFYGSWAQGKTVWQDSLGAWHESAWPDNERLMAAQAVYDGGHVHEVTDSEATALLAAGYALEGHVDAEEQKWIDYALAADDNLDFMGGDGFATQELGTAIIATTADNIIGTTDADGYYATESVARNAMFLLASDGSITGQVFPTPGSPPGLLHGTPGAWYWPLDLTLDGTGDALSDLVCAALDMGPGAGFGEFVGNVLLTFNAFGGVDTAVPVTPWGTEFQVSTIYNDSDYHYMTANGGGDITTIRSYTVMARAPLGSLLTMASWEHWTGTEWSSTGDPGWLVDSHGARIEGGATLTKVGTDFVLAVGDFRDYQFRLYRSTTAQGPWTYYHTTGSIQNPQGRATDRKTQGSAPNGGYYVYYQPKFHEWLAPASNTLVLSYNRNVFADGFPTDLTVTGENDYHVSTFCPQFIYVPAPEA